MFKSFFELLSTLLKNNNRTFLGQVMAGAGVGLVSVVGLTSFVDYYKLKAIQSLGSLGAVSGLLGLAGVDKAISIVIGAYICSVYIKTFASGLKVVSR